MPTKNTFVEYVVNDVLSGVGDVTSRAMFGGYSLYKDGLIFAIIANDQLYFKASDSNLEDYKKYGSKQFEYSMKNGKTGKMAYWKLPDEILEDRNEIILWVNRSLQVAREKKK